MMKCQTDPEVKSSDAETPTQSERPLEEISKDELPTNEQKQDPDLAIEWQDMKISFCIVPDFDWDQEQKNQYELFPKFDTSSPSARNIPYMKRKANREKYNGSTLTSFLGHMPSERAGSVSTFSSTSKSAQEVLTPSPNERRGNEEVSLRRFSISEGTKQMPDTIDGPKKCHLCGKGFSKASYLKRHVLSHSSVKPYRCDICNWGFFQHCNLKRHMASHTLEDGAAGFKCEHCSANFTTKSVLSVHLRDAHGDKLLTKKEAQRSAAFDRTSPLSANTGNLSHLGQKMAIKGPQVSRGGFPPRITVGRGGQVARMGASTGNIPFARSPSSSLTKFQSPSSSSALSGVSNVNSSRNVSNNGWSRCTICNKSFLTPANLRQHMLLHPGSKPFRCNFCGMRFAQKLNLQKHMVCHVAGNGHPCPHCNINFRTQDDVAQHVLKQHSSVTTSHEASNRCLSPAANAFQRQQEQRFHQRNLSDEQQTGQKEIKIERNRLLSTNENRINDTVNTANESAMSNIIGENEDQSLDDEEEVEIPSPEQSMSSTPQDHFVIQGNPVTSTAPNLPPQMTGGALPHLPPLPQVSISNKGGSYTCSICMDTFDKVGLLNKHIIFKHSIGASINSTSTLSKVSR